MSRRRCARSAAVAWKRRRDRPPGAASTRIVARSRSSRGEQFDSQSRNNGSIDRGDPGPNQTRSPLIRVSPATAISVLASSLIESSRDSRTSPGDPSRSPRPQPPVLPFLAVRTIRAIRVIRATNAARTALALSMVQSGYQPEQKSQNANERSRGCHCHWVDEKLATKIGISNGVSDEREAIGESRAPAVRLETPSIRA